MESVSHVAAQSAYRTASYGAPAANAPATPASVTQPADAGPRPPSYNPAVLLSLSLEAQSYMSAMGL